MVQNWRKLLILYDFLSENDKFQKIKKSGIVKKIHSFLPAQFIQKP